MKGSTRSITKTAVAVVATAAVLLGARAGWTQAVSPIVNVPFPPEGVAEVKKPAGMSVSLGGILALADREGHHVHLFDLGRGRYLQTVGTEGKGTDGLKEPNDVAVTDQYIFVADTGNKRIHIFDIRGNHQGVIADYFKKPVAVAVDDLNFIYVVDADLKKLFIFDSKTNLQKTIQGTFPGDDGRFKKPVDVAVDREGKVYVVDAERGEIAVYGPGGNWEFTHAIPMRVGDKKFEEPVSLEVNDWEEMFLFDRKTTTMYYRENAEPGSAWLPYAGGRQLPLGQGGTLAIHAGKRPLVYFTDLEGGRILGVQLSPLPPKERLPSRRPEEEPPPVPTETAQELAVKISQGVIAPEGVQKLYVNVTDLEGNFFEGLDASCFSVMHERRRATVTSARPFLESGEGMALMAVVETGATIDASVLERIQEGLRALVGDLGTQDRLGIITYGENPQTRCGITQEKEKLLECVDELKIEGESVPMRAALGKALEALDDDNLPTRRAIILLGTGEDRGEPDPELVSRLKNCPVQISAVLLSLETMDQTQVSQDLRSLAEKSGGVFLTDEGRSLAELLRDLYRDLRETYLVEYESELIDTRQDLQTVQVAVVKKGTGSHVRTIPLVAGGGGFPWGTILLILLIVIVAVLLIWLLVWLISRGRLLGHISVEMGPGEGDVFEVRSRRPLRIGASEEGNEIVIASPYVSRWHATVEFSEGELFITDVESANKTAVNGEELVPHEAHPLEDGDHIFVARKGGEDWVAELLFEAR
jgi:hypothetical protein